MLKYDEEMRMLFWRMHGKIALRVVIHEVSTNLTISKDLQEKIENSPKIEWQGGFDLFQGTGSGKINNELVGMRADVEKVFCLLKGFNGFEVTAGSVSTVYKKMIKKGYPLTFESVKKCMTELGKGKVRLTMVECCEWLRDYKESNEKLEKSTLETYDTRITNLVNFLKTIQKPKMQAESFSPTIAVHFEDWMRGRGITKNHIARHIIFFKEAMRMCESRDFISSFPLMNYVCSRQESQDLRHLEWEDLKKLEELDLSNHPLRLQRSRDMYLFCCYTGFHHCDREALKPEDMKIENGKAWIIKTRQKTKKSGAMAIVKLHPEAMRIIDKYGGIAGMPNLDNHDMNYDLKILEKMIGVSIGLSTKIARKTFAHLCYNHWLIDSDTVAAMMGLKDAKHIKKYGKVTEKRVDMLVPWGGSPDEAA